jgi:phospholipid/cholesterol/gamma-HCH transport system substrate-binding protein
MRVNRRTEIKVGLTVLVAAAILLWGLAWIKDYSLGVGRKIWHVEFPETGGLAASDEVQVNGLRKGEVLSMRLQGDRVRVELSLDPDITLTRDSKIAIRNVGLMGEKVVAVDLRATGTPYRPDELIQGQYDQGLPEAMGQLGTTLETISKLANELQATAEAMNKHGGLSGTIDNFNRTSEELRLAVSENRASLRSAITNFSAASGTARRLTTDREAQLRETLDRFASAAEKMDRLSGRLDSLRAVMQSVTDKVDRGEGTLGRLVHDDRLYSDLNDSVRSLKALIEDVRAHPKKYFKVSLF